MNFVQILVVNFQYPIQMLMRDHGKKYDTKYEFSSRELILGSNSAQRASFPPHTEKSNKRVFSPCTEPHIVKHHHTCSSCHAIICDWWIQKLFVL